MCWNTYFIVFFEHQPKFAPKKGQKPHDNLHFPKHRLITKNKKRFVATPPPPFTKNCCFSTFFGFLKPKTLMLNKKHNFKSGKNKDKKKGFQRENKTENQKKREDWWTKIWHLNISDVVPFMKPKQRRKKRKERDKTRNQKKAKIKDKNEGKRTRTREREREREPEKEKLKKGKAKKG